MSSERRAEKERRERENSVWRGAYGVVKGLIGYVLLPMVLMTYVFPMLPSDLVLDGIEDMLGRCMVGGIPLIAVAFPMGYYGKGHIGRVLAWVAFIVLKILWMLYVLDFGDLDGIFRMYSGDVLLTVDLAVSGIVTLAAFFLLLKLVVVVADHHDNRKRTFVDDYRGVKDDRGRGVRHGRDAPGHGAL